MAGAIGLWGERQPFAAHRQKPSWRCWWLGAILCRRPGGDNGLDHARHGEPVGRRADRPWPVGLLAPSRSRSAQGVLPENWAQLRLQRGRGGPVRPVSVLATRPSCSWIPIAGRTRSYIFAVMILLVLPLVFVLAAPKANETSGLAGVPQQSLVQALRKALGHRSYVLLVMGFFTCGLPLQFRHHPHAALSDRPGYVGTSSAAGPSLSSGLFNIVVSAGLRLAARRPCPSASCCRSSTPPARWRWRCSSRCRSHPSRA